MSAPPRPRRWRARWLRSCRHSAAARFTPRRTASSRSSTCCSTRTASCCARSAGDTLTAYRTPAACALAIRALAVDSGASVTTAALVGAGRQGLKHLEMLAAELPALAEIRVADLNPDNQSAVVASANAAGIPATCAKDAASAVRRRRGDRDRHAEQVAAVPG